MTTKQKQQRIYIKKLTSLHQETNCQIENRNSNIEDAYKQVLHLFKNGNIYKYRQILDIVNSKYHNETSIIPSDYCYNRINLGIIDDFERRLHFFVYLARDTYKYIGPNAFYTGFIELANKKKIVGRWKNGKLQYLDKNIILPNRYSAIKNKGYEQITKNEETKNNKNVFNNPTLAVNNCEQKIKTNVNKSNINNLWYSQYQQDWKKALDNYYNLVKPYNYRLEQELDNLEVHNIKKMTVQQFYNFLHDKYFVWKYTAPNRLSTTIESLEKYILMHNLKELEEIHSLIFEYNLEDIQSCLKNAQRINGLGIAGASGLLSLLFPKYFGTVDQFVVKRLLEIEKFDKHSVLLKMKPESLTLKDGVILIEIMRNKASELNELFKTNKWTPRKLDKILWSIDR